MTAPRLSRDLPGRANPRHLASAYLAGKLDTQALLEAVGMPPLPRPRACDVAAVVFALRSGGAGGAERVAGHKGARR